MYSYWRKMKSIRLIYILSTSYSGSTILGYLLGSNDYVFNLGELKYYSRIIKRKNEFCSCGKYSHKCPFWKDIYKSNLKIFGLPSSDEIKKTLKSTFFYTKSKNLNSNQYDEQKLLKVCYQKAKKQKKQLKYLVDTSKSLWRLNHLLAHKNIKIKLIYLKRDIKGNISSFIKHGHSFTKGLAIYKINNFLIRKYLKNNKIDYIEINYKNLCKFPREELVKIEKYLNLDYSNYIQNMKNANFHVPAGNRGVQKQFLNSFEGLYYDNSWKERLNPWQKKVLKILS